MVLFLIPILVLEYVCGIRLKLLENTQKEALSGVLKLPSATGNDHPCTVVWINELPQQSQILKVFGHLGAKICHSVWCKTTKTYLHPKFSQNLGMLDYCESRKDFKNNSTCNSVDNPISKPLIAFILFSFHW